MGVIGDEGIGEAEDARAGAVVLFQHDDLEGRIVLLEAGQVLGPGAAPGVDGLVVVADHGEGAPRADQTPDQFVLGAVGVLILVHQQVTQARLPALQQLGLGGEEARRRADEVVEIDGVVGVQAVLVVGVEAGEVGLEVILGVAEGLGGLDEGVLPGRDTVPGRRRGQGVSLTPAPQVLLDDGLGVLGVKQGEAASQPGVGVVAAQDVEAQGVEGGDGEAPALPTLEVARDPGLHLARRLVGEGDGGDVARRQAAFADRWAILRAMTRVLPDPAPASTSKGPPT